MSKDEDEYRDALDRIENLVGKLRGNQKYEVIDAIDENRDGVMILAEKIAASDGIDAPAAVLIASIRRGEHREAAGGSTKRMTPRAAFRAFFDDYREWLMDVCDLDENRAIEWGLDYAVNSLSSRTPYIGKQAIRVGPYERGQTALTLEEDMRVELGRPTPRTTGAARVQMQVEWAIIGLCMHNVEFAAMHRALMEQCAIPREPSHAEARVARAALIDEIRHRRIEPKKPPGPLGDALWDAVKQVGTLRWSDET